MRPTQNNLCCFLGGPTRAKEYCHQKLITIKISGEKAVEEKIVQTEKREKVLDECPTMGTNMSSAGEKD